MKDKILNVAPKKGKKFKPKHGYKTMKVKGKKIKWVK